MIVARNLLLSFALATSTFAGTYSITTNADSGPGSLRQAILDANSGACASPCTITFGSTGPITIAPLTPLPNLDASNVTIGPDPPFRSWSLELRGDQVSSGSGLHIRGGNVHIDAIVVNGFPGNGLVIEGGDAVINSCIIGLDASLAHAVPNQQNGVLVAGAIHTVFESNTISGNLQNGVYALGGSDLIFGLNIIGRQFGNGATGVFLQNVLRARFDGDIIADNALDGIATLGATRNVLVEGEIPVLLYNNGLMPFDIGFDGVTDTGRPVLTTADTSNGFMRVVGQASAAATIDVFAGDRINAFGVADAKTWLYTARATAAGPFEFRFRLPSDVTGQWISATATTADSTSELSAPLKAQSNDQIYSVSTTGDSGPGSLRQAILDANAGICSEDFPCRITFPFPGPPHVTIAIATPLPPITRSGIVVDGGGNIEINGSASTAGPGLTISAGNGKVTADTIRNIAITNFNGPGILIDARANQILAPLIDKATVSSNRGDGILVQGDVPFVHNGTYGSNNRIQFSTIGNNGGSGVRLEGGFFELDTNTISGNGASGVDIEAIAGAHLERNTITLNRDVGLSIAATIPAAFKASIANMIDANAGDAIRQQPTVEAPPVITSATYDPATNTATIKGTVAPSSSQGWTTAIDLYTSQFPEAGGRGSGEKVLLSSYSVSPVGPSFTFTAAADIRGLRVSGTATPFIYQGFKGPPANDIFGQGFEYGTTSEFSRAVPVTTSGCPADLPQLLGSSANELRWSTVAGASAYNVWLRTVPGVPRMIGTTSADRLTITVAPGAYEWFVEAVYPGCPGMKSDAARFSVGRTRPSRH